MPAPLTGRVGWAAIKRKLDGLRTAEIVNLVRDLYQASPETRRFLQGRFLRTPAVLERYRRRVMDAVFPDPLGTKQVRMGEAARLIRHYRLSTADEAGAVDLMLAMVEAGTEQAADLGYAGDAYFASLERALKSVVGALPSLPAPAGPLMLHRLGNVARRAQSIGWGYGDAVRDIIAKHGK